MKTVKRSIFSLFLTVGFLGSLHAQDNQSLTLTLDKALEIALSKNPTIKIAGKEIERLEYAKKEAWGNFFPTIDAVGQYERNIKKMVMSFQGQTVVIGSNNTFNAGITASVPLFNMSLYKMTQLSELNIELALENSRGSRINMKNEVEKAFYLMLLTQDLYAVMQKSMNNAQESYEDVKNKYEQGLVAEFDLIRTEVQVSNLQPNLIEAENSVELAKFQLKLLTGIPLDENIIAEGSLVDYESEYVNFNDLYNYALDQNVTLKQLELQNQLLNKQLELQKASYLPSVGLSYNYMFMSMSDDLKISDYNWHKTSTLGLSVRMPIFSGFTRKHKTAQIKSNIEALKLQRDYAATGLNVQVKNALTNMQKATEQLESNKTGIRAAEKAYSIAQVRYKSGMGILLELNDADTALRQAQLNYNQSIYNYMTAKSNYDLLLGKEYTTNTNNNN